MADTTSGMTVEDNEAEDRYEATAGGEVIGVARYVRRGGRTIFVHTEVDGDHEGEGVGSALVSAALDPSGPPSAPSCRCARSCGRTSSAIPNTPTSSTTPCSQRSTGIDLT